MNFNHETGAYVAVSSIDLLEECLDSIHRARKNSLDARGVRANAILEKRRSKLQSQSRYRPVSDSGGAIPLRSPEAKAARSNPNPLENVTQRDEATPSPVEITEADDSVAVSDDSSNERIATNIFEEFQKEVVDWWSNQPEKREDDDCKGEFADYLTDKYMCQKLDALPSSPTITALRKKIYKIIEEFAADEKFRLETYFPTLATVTEKALNPKKTIDHHSNSKASKPALADRKPDSKDGKKKVLTPAERALAVAANPTAAKQASSSSTPATGTTTVEQKRAQEKDKIQEQYATYMKMKQKTVEAESKEQLQQYEQLNDDIRGLLSSIQNSKPLK